MTGGGEVTPPLDCGRDCCDEDGRRAGARPAGGPSAMSLSPPREDVVETDRFMASRLAVAATRLG